MCCSGTRTCPDTFQSNRVCRMKARVPKRPLPRVIVYCLSDDCKGVTGKHYRDLAHASGISHSPNETKKMNTKEALVALCVVCSCKLFRRRILQRRKRKSKTGLTLCVYPQHIPISQKLFRIRISRSMLTCRMQ